MSAWRIVGTLLIRAAFLAAVLGLLALSFLTRPAGGTGPYRVPRSGIRSD